MRFDPRRRLDRRVPGAAVQPGQRLRLHLEEERPLPQDPVPARDQQVLREVKVRAPARLAQAGPNAPQLIRLRRYPYALTPGRPTRQELVPPSPTAEPRAPFGDAMRTAQADWPEARSPRAVQPRPRAFAPRPSAAVPIPPLPEEKG